MKANERVINILKQLIAIPSWVGKGVDSKDNERKLADFLFDYLSHKCPDLKIEKQLVKGDRVNLIVSNSDDPEVLFTSHLDTVSPGDKWRRDPFNPVIEDDLIYGLGSVDMKGGMACVVTSIEEFGQTTEIPFSALFYCGEEYDFCGMKTFMAKAKIRPKIIVNPEPTDCEIIDACRGVFTFSLVVEGQASHSARPAGGVNAIGAAYEAIKVLNQELGLFGELPKLGSSTLNVARINGGSLEQSHVVGVSNKIANYAKVMLEIRRAHKKISRSFIEQIAADAITRYGAKLKDFKVHLDVYPLLIDMDEKLLPSKLRNLPRGDTSQFGYFDTQLISGAWQVPSFVFGPSPNNMSHRADEHISISSLIKTYNVIKEFFTTFK